MFKIFVALVAVGACCTVDGASTSGLDAKWVAYKVKFNYFFFLFSKLI